MRSKKKSYLLYIYQVILGFYQLLLIYQLILTLRILSNLSAIKSRILVIYKPKFFTYKKSLLDIKYKMVSSISLYIF